MTIKKVGEAMLKKTYFPDLERHYVAFTHSRHYPKLERLNNWGKQRFFLAQYFDLVEDSYDLQQIVLRYQQHYIYLDIAQAPDFMKKVPYLSWLRQQLERQALV